MRAVSYNYSFDMHKKGDHRKPVQFVAERKGKERKKQKLSILSNNLELEMTCACAEQYISANDFDVASTHTHCMLLPPLPLPAFASAIFVARRSDHRLGNVPSHSRIAGGKLLLKLRKFPHSN